MNRIIKIVIAVVFAATIIFASLFAYLQSKVNAAENSVAEYMVKEKHEQKGSFKANGFYANQGGGRNYMVEVKKKDDPNYYYYYIDKNDKVKLDFYLDQNNKKHTN